MSVFSPAQLAAMQRVQESTMRHRATFLRYDPVTNCCSGQHVNHPYPEMEIRCGLDHAHGNSRATTQAGEQPAIGGEISVTHYRALRLPRSMECKAVPLSQYVVTHVDGQPLPRPIRLEQVGDAEAGPSGVVVKVKDVVV